MATGVISNLGGKIAELNSNLSSLITYRRYEIEFGQCSPNTDYVGEINVERSGYTPIGILDYTIIGTYRTSFFVSAIGVINFNTLRVNIRSNSSIQFITDNTVISVLILYRKNL